MNSYKTITLPSLVIQNPTEKIAKDIILFGIDYFPDLVNIQLNFDGAILSTDDSDISYRILMELISGKNFLARDIFGLQLTSSNKAQLREKVRQFYFIKTATETLIKYNRWYSVYNENDFQENGSVVIPFLSPLKTSDLTRNGFSTDIQPYTTVKIDLVELVKNS